MKVTSSYKKKENRKRTGGYYKWLMNLTEKRGKSQTDFLFIFFSKNSMEM